MDQSLCALRAQFPLLEASAVAYFDSAATTQKPHSVLARMEQFYRSENANVHRAAHSLSATATTAFEEARQKVARFINAPKVHEVIWTSGTTAAINLVAQSWGLNFLGAGDEILVTALEHHANLVPWQQVAARTGAQLKIIPLDDRGDVDLEAYRALLNERTKLVAISHISNALGTVNPIETMIPLAKAVGAVTLIDGAQAIAHRPVDVQALGCDFYVFSGHKLYAPTGIGVLWGRSEWLEAMPPITFGGEMIEKVSYETATFNRLPFKFEAGTPAIAEVIGLGAAIDFLTALDWQVLQQHEAALLTRLEQGLNAIAGVKIIGTPRERSGVLSFVMEGVHPSDVATLLDMQGLCLRSGHHCTMPLMQSLGLNGTVRASIACYTTLEEVERLLNALQRLEEFF